MESNSQTSGESIYSQFDLELAEEFNFTKQCFYESLRIEAPIPLTSTNMFNVDVQMSNGMTIRKGDMF